MVDGSLSSPDPGDLSHLRLLVVDDDPIMIELAADALNQIGVTQIETASDGLMALGKVSASLNVILCDLNMPGMDGVAFMRELAQHSFDGAIVLVTGETTSLLRTAVEVGHAHALNLLGATRKPITADNLGQILHRYAAPNRSVPVVRRLRVTPSLLRNAIFAERLRVFYQPKVRMDNEQLAGVEALVRWQDPHHGLIMPDEFIGIAEDNDLINALTAKVMAIALADVPLLCAYSDEDFTISINLSARSLQSAELPDQFEALVRNAGLVPRRVILELTESRMLEHGVTALEVLARLRLKGFGLSIDDFGTGYSSLEQLRTLPFGELKIDKSFVQAATQESSARAVVEASITLAHKLDLKVLKVVAEGIETNEQWDLVRTLGCDQAQGYLVARPMPLIDFTLWAARWTEQHAVPTPGLTEYPVLDRASLIEIVGEHPDKLLRYLAKLVDQADQASYELRERAMVADWQGVSALGHKLKSAARSVGAHRLGEVCYRLEIAGKADNETRVRTAMSEFDVALDELKQESASANDQ